MGINRSGYYKWVKRKANPSLREISRNSDIQLIEQVHKKHPSHGYRWINAYIRRKFGIYYSDNHVHLCCKYAGIISNGKHYNYRKPGDQLKKYDNLLLNKKWNSLTRPFEVIVSDMTAFWANNKYYELTFYFDAYTKEILSYSLSSRKGDTKTYYDGLKTVLDKIKMEANTEEVTILHTDQGSVYASISYNKLIEDYNIKRSMSRAGTPTDNPVNESLNGWIKEELFVDFKLNKSNNVFKTINEYVYYYNNERPAYSLKYKTPIQFKTEQRF